MGKPITKLGKTKKQLADEGIPTFRYHKMLLRAHFECMKDPETTIEILFNATKKQYLTKCDNCITFTKSDVVVKKKKKAKKAD